jgi:hypothetical protein
VRVARSPRLVAEGYPLATVARVLMVSRQALYRTPKLRAVLQWRPPTGPIERAIVEEARGCRKLEFGACWSCASGAGLVLDR